ncbi:MAG: heparinase II/III family protein, partial [Candidatus Latescibacteria bacterium]|nr:heparinase II/III family protein [Candidatus Latescibacterota bacterium]
MNSVREYPKGADQIDHEMPLQSFNPEQIHEKLDFNGEGLAAAKQAAESGDQIRALTELRDYYRVKYPLSEATGGDFENADKICRRVIQWGPYEEAQYGDEFDWEWDPRGDIEWVAAVYRFYWAGPLAQAYAATRDEKYAQAFVDLTMDWIAKHPLETHT